MDEGNIRSALRILSSDDTMAPNNNETLQALNQKHPPRQNQPAINPIISSRVIPIKCFPNELKLAIKTFPSGSSGGLSEVRPDHLTEMFHNILEQENLQVSAFNTLLKFVNFVLNGCVPSKIQPLFFGARLIALNKKSGGVRPIAVSNTCLLYTSPSPRDKRQSRMPSSA